MKLKVEERPPYSGLEYALEATALSLVGLQLYVLFTSLPELPDQVPVHFGAGGEPDRFGPTEALWLLPGISVALFLLLAAVARYSKSYNVPWRVPEESRTRQFRLARTLVVAMQVYAAALFTYITWQTVRIALGEAGGLGGGFVAAAVLIPLGMIAIYVTLARQNL
ncbi:DUF1648 domain-containing protein [Rubrobacter taiwanensis]|jgi:uncharacterized membrane protein|uniref:DUF1648 domain-containing protein n=1 Tax=Rubrobacter taiwanensis TaxID=185139 RepID=A0A4R1BTQ2_9ACTN|nr:DUF1648 domain-containing protein [Rubrobacter taiwanensis]TCJ20665.1 DUF1648 domain-containing protein [Rubrobacter taiwanensis]